VGFPEERLSWARENGWVYEARRTIQPDLFGQLSWRGPGERDRATQVQGEIRGRYAGRPAFAHDRPLPLLRAEVRAQVRYGRISGVAATTDLPTTFVLLDRSGFRASVFPMPWAEGLTVARRPFGTTTAVWAQPGYEDLALAALAPLLQQVQQVLEGGSGGDYLVGTAGRQVLVGEQFSSGPRAALYRMGLADDVATRLEGAVLAR